jgi:DNA invertase Pin-like site-specific DNA recombinase
MPITAKKLRVTAYCRVSTKSEDQLNSYEAQMEFYTEYISSKPEWEFIGLYADEGISGTKLRRRKRFNDMIRDALDGKIDLIIVKSVSRFARNTVDSLSTVRALREKGVKVFFEQQNIDSLDPKCDMMLSIHASLAEDESRQISSNVRWRKQKQVEMGECGLNFSAVYGYRQEKKNKETGEVKPITICEAEAEVVRDIYFKYLIGGTYREIARSLDEQGVKPPHKDNKKGLWHVSTIKGILENEKYMGDIILQKTYARDFLAERRVKNTGQAPQKYVENNHPAIVDRATWYAAQAEMERRVSLRSVEDTGKGRYSGTYAFSGKIECGCCGAGFRRHSQRGIGLWTCKQHIKSAELCDMHAFKEKYLEDVFVKTLNGLVFNRKAVLNAVSDAVDEAMLESGEGADWSKDLNAVDSEIEKLQDKILELNKRRGRREIDAESYNSESLKVMARLDALFAEKDKLSEQRSASTLNKKYGDIVASLLGCTEEQATFDKEIFAKLVDTIIVKSREHIVFLLKDGTEVRAIAEDATA